MSTAPKETVMRDLPQFEIYIEGDPDQAARAWFSDKTDAEFFIKHLSPERIGTEFEWKIRPASTPLVEKWIVGNTIGDTHMVVAHAKNLADAQRILAIVKYGEIQSRLVSPWVAQHVAHPKGER